MQLPSPAPLWVVPFVQTHDLRKDKETLQADKLALVEQLVTKDKQIERFFSSERDTKTLFGTLQSLVASILPGKPNVDRYAPVREAIESGLPEDQSEERLLSTAPMRRQGRVGGKIVT